MVKIGVCIFVGLVLISQVNAGFCMDETNHFTVTEFEVSESASYPGQSLVSVTGFFTEPQTVDFMTFDFTLDGVNWLRRQAKVDEVFGADHFNTYHISINIEGVVESHSKAVLGFMEDDKMVWCDYVDLHMSYTNRRLSAF
jgi:hypothetical protein